MLDVYDILEYVRMTQKLEGALSGQEYSDALSDYLRRKRLDMATRSKIAMRIHVVDEDPFGIIVTERHIYRAVYVHWDGHPETRYPLLREYYNTEEAARAIVDVGDMSSLGCTLEDSVVYGPEDASGPNDYATFKELLTGTSESMGEYLYLWEDGKWNVYSMGGTTGAVDMTRGCERTWNNGGYEPALASFRGEKK